jgi:hypothetical protein
MDFMNAIAIVVPCVFAVPMTDRVVTRLGKLSKVTPGNGRAR